MKRDIFNHEERWNRWKELITDKYIEPELTKENSRFFLDYLFDMEQGRNIPPKSPKGCRDKKTLNRLRIKVKAIFKLFQANGCKDITKIQPNQVTKIFQEWRDKNHSNDYAKRFKAMWNWWIIKNYRQGKEVKDVGIDLDTSANNEPPFVWMQKKELDEFLKYFNKDEQTILLFAFDSIIRAPTEISSLKVSDVTDKGDEIWINIPKEISKTFGRKFNLVYSGKALRDYIKRNDLEQEDYIFSFSSVYLNRKMQGVAKKMFDNKKSEGGEYFNKITIYDLRHSGAIHFRQLFQKTGQSLDALRHRGGWADFKMLNYYSRFLGLDGEIKKDKLLIEEDKTKLEKEVGILKKHMQLYREVNRALIKTHIERLKTSMENKELTAKERERMIKLKQQLEKSQI